MKKIILLSLFVLTLVLSAKTTTNVTLQTPYEAEDIQNDYGDKIMYQNVKINTQNFKINNFWGKFSDAAQDQSNFTNIATAANVKLTIENVFTCKDGGLPEEGCSGQKPFLINDGTLANPELKKDAMGQVLPAGEYRIPFDSAQNYDANHDDAFYALDVFRDGKYYQDDGTDDYNNEKPKTFFGYMIQLIKTYFSPQNDTTVVSALTQNTVEARNRYMANIVFGLQQEYRIKKESAIDTNSINQASATKQPSLLDYNALMINDTTGCDGIFFTFNPDSLTCKFQNFFGMSQWMPFFGNGASLLGENSNKSSIQSDSVLEDTETTLLTLASKLDNTNYVQPKIDQNTGRFPVLSEVFKPMIFMAKSMFRFFFGENSKTLTETVSVNFDFTNHMPLTFMQVQNGIVKGFEYFKLLGIESVYGTEVQSCKVKQTKNFFFFPIGWDSKTFTEGVVTNTEFDMNSGLFGWATDSTQYDLLNVTTESNWYWFPKTTHDIVNLSTEDWLNWCKRNQGRQKKGLFGRFFDSVGNIVSFVLYGKQSTKEYDAQVDKVLRDDDWSVVEYKEKVHKGLILHLKKIDIEDINATTPGTTTEFEIIKVSRERQNRNDQSNSQNGGMH
ncbi:hypothetical protein FJR45_10450 [Sulfurimonas sediminis]|uniref:Uncharacterized protein n=1 Tax=Sulfurimonas sediminis TaxID=2590020 RepID=A0A7M1B6L9_9BACT|nr:hypothetical protein [Sulfurimonas sediminis]QOP44342.1 hypothetical protein FJR45_10450 [Sulfurimonas sediminis]